MNDINKTEIFDGEKRNKTRYINIFVLTASFFQTKRINIT